MSFPCSEPWGGRLEAEFTVFRIAMYIDSDPGGDHPDRFDLMPSINTVTSNDDHPS